MRSHPLLAVEVIIIFHASEASQLFNKCFFFSQDPYRLGAIYSSTSSNTKGSMSFIFFMQCFQADVIYHQEYLHIPPKIKSMSIYLVAKMVTRAILARSFLPQNIQGFPNTSWEQSTHFFFQYSITYFQTSQSNNFNNPIPGFSEARLSSLLIHTT